MGSSNWGSAGVSLLVCCRWKSFIVKKLHSRKIFSYVSYLCSKKFLQRKKVNYYVHVNGSIRPLSCACGHLVMCLSRLLLQTGLQLLHGYLGGLLTILGALKKPPWGITKITLNKLRQFPEVSSIIRHSFGIYNLFLYCSRLTSVSTISLSI